MLKALDIEPPLSIVAHGWWMVGNTKMSKSRGNVVAPLDMAKLYGNDAYRYFLLRDVPFGMDGSFSEESIIKRSNGDLANDLGNLVYRTLTMVEKYYQGAVPAVDINTYDFDAAGKAIVARIAAVEQEMAQEIDAGSKCNFAGALERLWELVNMANKYVEETKPWNLSKDGKTEQLQAFMRLLVEVIRKTGSLLEPFMPATGRSIREQAGSDTICKGAPLFPRIETEESKRKEKK
jgi:methionyl-tRNA synthetase